MLYIKRRWLYGIKSLTKTTIQNNSSGQSMSSIHKNTSKDTLEIPEPETMESSNLNMYSRVGDSMASH